MEQKQDLCALIDVYNPSDRIWFKNQSTERIFNNLKQFNSTIDGFFFSGVQVSGVPKLLELVEVEKINPDYFQLITKRWQMVSEVMT